MIIKPIHGPRTGTGTTFLIIGFILLVMGVVVSCGSTASLDPGMAAGGGLMVLLGSAAVGVGFVVGLVHKIELRLIDIQTDARDQGRGSDADTPSDVEQEQGSAGQGTVPTAD